MPRLCPGGFSEETVGLLRADFAQNGTAGLALVDEWWADLKLLGLVVNFCVARQPLNEATYDL